MTVFKDNNLLAQEAVKAAVAIVEGTFTVPSTTIYNGMAEIPYPQFTPQVITQDNIDILIDAGYLLPEELGQGN